MTKQTEAGIDSDAFQACVDWAEITPAMIEAGLNVLEGSGRLIEPLLSGDELLVAQVFSAMIQFRQDG